MTSGDGFNVQTACVWEATARKVGNVHPGAAFADTTYVDFLLSAAAIGPIWGTALPSVGDTVLKAVRETRRHVGKNTNLGMILLLAPFNFCHGDDPLRDQLRTVLANLDAANDASQVFAAIRLAKPGGLGDAPQQDVRDEPTVTLLEAMTLAADRDLVARQYATGYTDVFDFGVPAFLDALARHGTVEAAVVDTQLRWLATYPDSLIARKADPAVAGDVQGRAADVLRLGGIDTPAGRRAGVALDAYLRSDGNRLNPGTTADLLTACLFVALRDNTVSPTTPFRWAAEDWLSS